MKIVKRPGETAGGAIKLKSGSATTGLGLIRSFVYARVVHASDHDKLHRPLAGQSQTREHALQLFDISTEEPRSAAELCAVCKLRSYRENVEETRLTVGLSARPAHPAAPALS